MCTRKCYGRFMQPGPGVWRPCGVIEILSVINVHVLWIINVSKRIKIKIMPTRSLQKSRSSSILRK